MPAKAHLLDVKQLARLCEKHSTAPFNPRDRALIACTGLAYFNLIDLSLIKVDEIIREDGEVYHQTYIPAAYNAFGKTKRLYIVEGSYLRKALLVYIDWRRENKLKLLDRDLYAGLDPKSNFFLQDDGSAFDVHYREKSGKPTSIEPYDMRRHFNKFYLGEGVDWQLLNHSFMLNYWKAKAPDKPAEAVKDLMELTAVDAATIRKKCARNEKTIRDVLEGLYR